MDKHTGQAVRADQPIDKLSAYMQIKITIDPTDWKSDTRMV